jgi:hypothetical protein
MINLLRFKIINVPTQLRPSDVSIIRLPDAFCLL